MAYPNTAKIYKQNQVTTASPKELVLLLYQGCIKNLRLAELSIDEKRLDLANEKLIKAQNIIQELMNTLNTEVGGEVALNLEALYDHFLTELVQANLKKDKEKIEYVRFKMNELLEAWTSI
ncbi:flagellar export chaperone FliS [Atopococcus tabaci]|uniref:flagellar export chaperone FliS n=1 Tax=Atopococcus tabaci TaxID=269774 RepID=UPI00041A599F|nr:flagellar export chaperone FliS [Atopococcus tabaci]